MKKLITLISDRLNRGAEFLLIGLLAGISLLIFIQVVFRYGFNHSIYWSEEVGRYTLIWITFIGASVGFKRKSHMGVDFLYKAFNNRTKQILTIISDVAVLILGLILTVYGIRLAKFVHLQSSAALLISMSIPYSAIWVGGFLTSFHSLDFLVKDMELLVFNDKKVG